MQRMKLYIKRIFEPNSEAMIQALLQLLQGNHKDKSLAVSTQASAFPKNESREQK